MNTEAGPVAVINGQFTFADMLGSWKARWGIGRMSYIVPPGLYAIGAPNDASPVLVTANYKMSFDLVRREMSTHNVWLLVLETYGINVWCAAGKGTFGTGELVRRIDSAGLSRVVDHRNLLLPIMGAAGVKAIDVKKRTGFDVIFATLRIEDLPGFISNDMHATEKMRQLTFSVGERLILTPIEVVSGLKSLPFVGLPLSALAGFSSGSFSLPRFLVALVLYLLALLCGTFLTPVFLPVLPGKMFAVKGAIVGSVCSLVCLQLLAPFGVLSTLDGSVLVGLMPAVSAFYAMNFTGSTPYTSPSGVRKEMKFALPVMSLLWIGATLLLLIGIFVP